MVKPRRLNGNGIGLGKVKVECTTQEMKIRKHICIISIFAKIISESIIEAAFLVSHWIS